jgi:hypothetical protein
MEESRHLSSDQNTKRYTNLQELFDEWDSEDVQG